MMKQGQIGFGGSSRYNTFGNKQSAIYSTAKSNRINDSIILAGDAENSTYYKGGLFNKNLLISDTLTMISNGNIRFSRK